MRDEKIPGIDFNNPKIVMGRWTGAGAANVVAPAGTSKRLSINRTGVGAHTITFLDPPYGTNEDLAVWVNSPTIQYICQVTPMATPFVSPYTLAIQIARASNGQALDIASTEELCMEAWFAVASQP